MSKIICGEVEYNKEKYIFNFRNNIIIIHPKEIMNYQKYLLEELLNTKKNTDQRTNVEGETSQGKYICFINLKFSNLGRGVLQAWVPFYILGTTNLISPLPKCTDIVKMSLEGVCLDKFCYPKNIIKRNDFFKEKVLKVELDYSQLKNNEFIIDGDVFSYDINWLMPNNDLNTVLNVNTKLNISFNKPKNINEIVDFYKKIEKFFSLFKSQPHH